MLGCAPDADRGHCAGPASVPRRASRAAPDQTTSPMRSTVLCACLCLAAGLSSANPPPVVPPTPAVEGVVAADVSEAELLLRIRRAISEDLERANLLRVRARYVDRESDAATRALDILDAALQPTAAPAPTAAAVAATVRDAGAAAAGAAPPVSNDAALDAHWRRARDLLDVLLQRRQSVEQQLGLLDAKRTSYEQAAEFVVSGRVEADIGNLVTATTEAPAGERPAATGAASGAAPPVGAFARGVTATQPAALPEATDTTAMPTQPEVYDSRVARAERELERELAAMRAAEHDVRTTEELISLNQDERTLVQAAMLLGERHAALLIDGARAVQPAASAASANATSIEPAIVDARVHDLHERAARATQAVERDRERSEVLEARLIALKELRDSVQSALIQREGAYELSRRQLSFLHSPLAPHRVLNWLLQALPRIAVLLAIFTVVWLLGRWLARRVVEAAVSRIRRSANEERVQRVQTLRRALRSVLTVVLALAVALIVLPEFGIDATVLLGSAAVFSLALAFGAQSLVKDYFSGFMILSENQYRIGNVVRINELSGVVEDISMRMTMLRDVEGIAHFVPHSEIRTVSNMSHGWAQALVDVRVGYREDIDRAMRELEQVARAMQHDATYGPLILAAPELWGVEELADSAVVVRLVVRTRPLKQWEVKRELLRRIKNRFDQLGIEMPLPQMTLQQAAPGRASNLAARR